MTHGYMFSGSGSNVYVQNLCRALVREGHEVHLLCQEPHPLDYDFVNQHLAVEGETISPLGSQDTSYPGRCAVYRTGIGGLLPVYVYDDYPGWRVKIFLDLTEEELKRYLDSNTEAVRAVVGLSDCEAVVTNHSVPGPLIARRALAGTGVPYVSIVHGSCLHYVSRRSELYMRLTREGLEGARNVLALSEHSAGTIAEDFPKMAEKTLSFPGGVDTKLFSPASLDLDAVRKLGGPGRGPEQTEALREAVEGTESATGLAASLREISASYDARSHDRDAGERISRLLSNEAPVVFYVGKLIHSKGVHTLLSALARLRREADARLLVIGYGTFREGLEALLHAMSVGDERVLKILVEGGRLFEGGPSSRLEHFTVSEELMSGARGMEDSVEFVGPLYHRELAKVLPAAESGAVPSIFPETFGLVAAELAASGVVPFVAGHSGLREAGGTIGRDLPFDLRVSTGDLEQNLARALGDYLQRPSEERQRFHDTVRRNSVERLGWDTLAERLAHLAGGVR